MKVLKLPPPLLFSVLSLLYNKGINRLHLKLATTKGEFASLKLFIWYMFTIIVEKYSLGVIMNYIVSSFFKEFM